MQRSSPDNHTRVLDVKEQANIAFSLCKDPFPLKAQIPTFQQATPYFDKAFFIEDLAEENIPQDLVIQGIPVRKSNKTRMNRPSDYEIKML